MDSQTTNTETLVAPIHLAVPNPPESIKYNELEDWRHKKMLELNGITLQENAVAGALTGGPEVLQVSAAHTAGAMQFASTIPALQALVTESDDLVQVEAAYALVRLGQDQGRFILEKCLAYPLDAYLCPPVAAGYLAQLGDPKGFPVIRAGLESKLQAVRMMACKQLYFFIPFQDRRDENDKPFEVLALFDRALHDADPDIAWQAQTQLREIASPQAAALLSKITPD